ncbi:MAG: mandelate racemase [Gammaproteobacteria bacterium]|nr:mandelate racemase [Gammaproteobacteria bacterium]
MRIDDITVTVWEWKDIPATRYTKTISSSATMTTQMGLVRIIADDGTDGYAFLGSALGSGASDSETLVKRIKPMLVGEDPLARERIWQSIMRRTRGTQMRILGAIDVALWDLAGRAADVPVHRLMGSYRNSIPAYASSAVYGSVEAYADEAVKLKEEGWTAYKIHPPADPDEDIAICQGVRRAVGEKHRLMLDSTWSYDYPQALRVGQAIQDLNYYWYEDPLVEDDIYNYVKLRQQLGIPIMATEFPQAGPTSYAPWITSQATDYLRGDVAIKGGLTSCLKTAHLAEAFHMNYEVHHGGNSLNNVANLHLLMAIRNCEYFEVLLPAAAQKHGLEDDIEVDSNGLVHAFEEPGLGAKIDFELIERNKIATLS